jgi:hypothetical protein
LEKEKKIRDVNLKIYQEIEYAPGAPVNTGSRRYQIELPFTPKLNYKAFKGAFLGGEGALKLVEKQFGLEFEWHFLDKGEKPAKFLVWVTPWADLEHSIDKAAEIAKCKHAYNFLQYWRWQILQDSKKDEPMFVSLETAAMWFSDPKSVEVATWIKDYKENKDPRKETEPAALEALAKRTT